MNAPVDTIPPELLPWLDFESLEREFAEEGGPDRIEARLNSALERFPGHGVALAARAWYFAKHADFLAGCGLMAKAIEAGPESMRVEWRCRLAVYRFRAGDWQAGLREFRELIETSPGNPMPRMARSYEMRSMGDHVSGELDEWFAMQMVGQVQKLQLFEFLRQNGPFSTKERLKASLFVLTDPLDPAARIYRGEMFMTMGAPLAAFYDLHLADVLQPRNLGLMARLEDIRMRGIMADPPPYDVTEPAMAMMPAYERVLGDYGTFLESVPQPPRRGVEVGWLERVFGRVRVDEPFDSSRTSARMIRMGLALGLVANLAAVLLAVALAIAGDSPSGQASGPGGGGYAPLTVAGVVLASLWAIAVLTGSTVATIGAMQRVCHCRISEMTFVLMSKRWYWRPPIVYGFIFLAAGLMFGAMALNAFLTFAVLWLLNQAGLAFPK